MEHPKLTLFTIQYLNAKWQNTAIGNSISFQVNLYESTGKISFVYRSETGVVTTGSASIGLAATATGSANYLSVDGTSTAPVANGYYETVNIATKPASGQTFAFTSGVPDFAPTNLQFMAVTANSITINWVDNSTNEDGYVIYNSTDGINYSFLLQTAAKATSSVFTGLTPNTKYYLKVYAVTEGTLSTALSGSQTTLCMSAAPVVTSPVSYCLNATATALTATGTNLMWNAGTVSGEAGGTAALSTNTYVDALKGNNDRRTNFTTTMAGVTITSVDYFIPANQTVNGIVLAIYNSTGTAIAISSTNTTQTIAATAVIKTNTFNYTIANAGNYSIGLYAGYGNVGSDNPTFPITEATGTINITGVNIAGYRCFNNIVFKTTGSATAPTPLTTTVGTINYTVNQTTTGCSAGSNATIAVIVTAPPAATIAYTGSPFCRSIIAPKTVTQTGTAGGAYTSTAGLTINSSTGAITTITSTVGTYIVTYTMAAAGGCTIKTATTSVTIIAAPIVTITSTPTCVGGSTGTLLITATGGITPYTYSLNTGAFLSTASYVALAAANDTIRVQGNNACITTTYITVNPYSTSTDNQNLAGNDTWIGHIYDGVSFNNYIGHITEPEVFNDSFGGSTVCLNVVSNVTTSSIYTETFSAKFKMNSTRKGLYVVDIGGDDANRLTVDGILVYNSWLIQSFVLKPSVLINLTGNSSLLYEYYENQGYNQLMFKNLKLIIANTMNTNDDQNVCMGMVGSRIIGDTFSVLPAGITVSGTGYQWSYSTSSTGTRTNIAGATAANFTPSSLVAPFNVLGTYYLYRTVNVTSTNNVGLNPYTITNESKGLKVLVNPSGSWTGNVNSDWTNTGNWACGTLPSATTDVMIPTGLTNYPVINSAGSVKNMTIQTGALVVVTGGVLQIAGTITNTGILDLNAGTLDMNGAVAQILPSKLLLNNTVLNLRITNKLGVTLTDTLFVTDVLSFGNVNNATLKTGGYLVLVSNAAGTSSVADITNAGNNSGNTITGNTMVQRYHIDKRAWILITAPLTGNGMTTTTAGDICSNWQANTFISGPITTGGLDLGVNNAYSMLSWTGTKWGYITNTKSNFTLFGNTGNAVADNKAFFIYVRGNRTVLPVSGSSVHTAVTLKATGVLQLGTKTFALVGTSYAAVANPYAAPIDLNVVRNDNAGLTPKFYYWDANVGTSGQYVTASFISGSWYYTNQSAANTKPRFIQSGQAFFVTPNGKTSVTFKETQKNTDSSSGVVFGNKVCKLRVDMSNSDGTQLIDGVLGLYNNVFSDAVIPSEDAYKFFGNEENLSIVRDSVDLSIESRKMIITQDTMFLSLNGMIMDSSYMFTITSTDMPSTTTATLIDQSKNTQTVLNLNAVNTYSFTMDTSAGSNAADRFMIVYYNANALSVTGLKLTATVKAATAFVNWTVVSEKEVDHYTIERSVEGVMFSPIASMLPMNKANSRYSYKDIDAVKGYNFYRIKASHKDASISYSNIVKVKVEKGNEGIKVYPNPVVGKDLNLLLNNIAVGSYKLTIYNESAVMMTEQRLDYTGTPSVSIQLPNDLTPGVYQIKCSGMGKEYMVRFLAK